MSTPDEIRASVATWAEHACHTIIHGRSSLMSLTITIKSPAAWLRRRSILLAINFTDYPPGTEAKIRELLGLEPEGEGDRSVTAVNAPRRWSVRPKT